MNTSNFTARYIGMLQNMGKMSPITDGDVPIQTIQVGDGDVFFNYSRPCITYDTLSSEEEMLEPDIIEWKCDMKSLREEGFEIYSVNIKGKGWMARQAVEYKIGRIGKHSRALSEIPNKYTVQQDQANNRVRLVGANCRDFFTKVIGATEWLNL